MGAAQDRAFFYMSDTQQVSAASLWTVLRLAIPCLLRLGFAGKCDDVRRAYGSEAWTARKMIDFAAHIPSHSHLACRGRWYRIGSSRCQMTCIVREDIRQAIPRQHDAAFGKRLDGRDVICGQDPSVLVILTATERPVAVGVLFGHGEALLSCPPLKTGFRQFWEPRSGMVGLEPERCGRIAHILEPLRPENEVVPERMETDRVCSFTDPDVEAGAAAVTLQRGKLCGEEDNGM